MDKIKIDTKGMDCPMPLIELKKSMEEAEKGQEIEVLFTCPEATVNLPQYCQENEIEVLNYEKEGNKFWRIVVRK
ncbi:MAG: sulfurtransferase TusA family protein [Synergistaceae bacterium]|nr:sulfurtransferase TusA family protein [Synergistaceae bacterium]NLY87737.1 sulfurtransferase TusA family protein [Clostridiales bacterium]